MPSEVIPPPKYIGYRVLHKIEGGNQATPPGMPEVTPPINSISLPMTEAIQKLSYALMRHFNTAITASLWTKVHRYDKAFTNGNGFEKTGDPRINYIANQNLTSPLPKYDKAQRLCGGQFVRGNVVGDYLECVAGVHGIDGSTVAMDNYNQIVVNAVENNWYLFAVSVNSDFTQISDFPQGLGGVVAIPFIFNGVIKFPLSYFTKWESDTLPIHTKIY